MKTKKRKSGFTIVELLTVMAIIAILMGLLVPALNQVRKLAKDTSQKAQFHAIDAALEGYYADNLAYPDSAISKTSNVYTVGAQKLAEALVGRDLFGRDNMSSWDAKKDELDPNSDAIYAIEAYGSTPAQVTFSLGNRTKLYLNPDKVEAFGVGQLYSNNDTAAAVVYPGDRDETGARIGTISKPAPVLTDVYLAKKVTLANRTTKMAGSPILYYKANTHATFFPNVDANSTVDYADVNETGSIYNGMDNEELINLYQMMNPIATNMHHFDQAYNNAETPQKNGGWIFYKTITNPTFITQPRPYNMDSYILISAGADAIYGTADDIYNFQSQ
ncbi:MAG: type II secretion system protein [Phycisphaerae bacterium]|jgi:type II secretory pathway pseudopilin PulG